jgi:hypothetical protein
MHSFLFLTIDLFYFFFFFSRLDKARELTKEEFATIKEDAMKNDEKAREAQEKMKKFSELVKSARKEKKDVGDFYFFS